MGGFSDRMLKTAIRLIDKFGNDLILKQFTTGYDPIANKNTTTPLPEVALIGAFEKYESEEIGGQVQTGDIKALIYHIDGVEYNIDSDKIEFDGVDYTLKNVSPVATQNQVVINELQLRR